MAVLLTLAARRADRYGVTSPHPDATDDLLLRPPTRRRIGDVLVSAGVLSQEDLQTALEAQRSRIGPRRRLGQIVVDLGLVSERDVADALGEVLRLKVLDLASHPVAPELAKLLPKAVAIRTQVVVLARAGKRLRVATSDPTNVLALDDVRSYTGATEIEVVVATETQIREQINRAWSLSEDSSQIATVIELLAPDKVEEDDGAAGGTSTEDAPTVRLVSTVLADAVRTGASDIHVEPQREHLRIRYRVDGVLREVMTVPRGAANALVSRMKIVSGLDIAERRVPQDGRTRITVDGQAIDARVSTLPSVHGEKVVIRLLARGDRLPPLDATGMDEVQLRRVRAAFADTQGLVLITGPTGSGKTSTLYAALNEVSTPECNVVTLEDPVEVQLPGITQVQVQEKTGMTFGRGLRSVLRQDPDIVLVGEIRDTETAELALRASLTGHLVLSTLHTNSAAAALPRLVDMGVARYLVASSLTCVVAQRLVRTPCGKCLRSYAPSPAVLDLLGLRPADLRSLQPKIGAGCASCSGTGYAGRLGVFEVMTVTRAVRDLLVAGADEVAIATQARAEGMATLREAALALAGRGVTTYEEVARVTPPDP